MKNNIFFNLNKLKMFNFQQKLNDSINKQINNFLKYISKQYEIPLQNLIDIWKNNNKEEEEIKEAVKEEVTEEVVKEVVKNKTGRCPYVFSRGKNKGKACGAKNTKNYNYCSKHKKYENKVPKKKKTEVPKNIKPESTIIRMNKKIGKFWHPENPFSFSNHKMNE